MDKELLMSQKYIDAFAYTNLVNLHVIIIWGEYRFCWEWIQTFWKLARVGGGSDYALPHVMRSGGRSPAKFGQLQRITLRAKPKEA